MIELVVIFATYMITSAIMYSSGPYGVLERFREQDKLKEFGLFDCFLCTSMYVALLVTFISALELMFFFVAWCVSYLIDRAMTIATIK